MPGPAVIPVQGDALLPREVDVVVIGGGIIGCSTALELAERGYRVALCEKGVIGGEQSSRNWGWVRISCRDPREVPLMAEALRIWRGLDQRLGRDTGFRAAGIVFAADTDRQVAEYAAWRRNLDGTGIESRMLSAPELAELMPSSAFASKGALYTPQDGRAEPQRAVPAIAEAARSVGAHVLTGCAARGIDTSGGAVSGVVTERGRIACQAAVLAAGAWSSLFAGNLGVSVPQLKVLNSVLRTGSQAGGPEPALWQSGFAIRRRQDGGYTIASGHENTVDLVPDSLRHARAFLPAFRKEWRSMRLRLGRRSWEEALIPRRWALDRPSPFESHRVLDPEPDRAALGRAMAAASRAFPALKPARVEQSWAGYIDVTPDALPVISAVDGAPGFFLATGFSGHGFGIGPAAGRLMADIVSGTTPLVDPAPFRFHRFSDGSRVEILGGV